MGKHSVIHNLLLFQGIRYYRHLGTSPEADEEAQLRWALEVSFRRFWWIWSEVGGQLSALVECF